jgi:hypothetical protein
LSPQNPWWSARRLWADRSEPSRGKHRSHLSRLKTSTEQDSTVWTVISTKEISLVWEDDEVEALEQLLPMWSWQGRIRLLRLPRGRNACGFVGRVLEHQVWPVPKSAGIAKRHTPLTTSCKFTDPASFFLQKVSWHVLNRLLLTRA